MSIYGEHPYLISIIAISEQTFWSAVPPSRDIFGKRLFAINSATGTEISELDAIIHEENVFSIK